jgi:hypothetical protein
MLAKIGGNQTNANRRLMLEEKYARCHTGRTRFNPKNSPIMFGTKISL